MQYNCLIIQPSLHLYLQRAAKLDDDLMIQCIDLNRTAICIAVFSFTMSVKLDLHSNVGITPMVIILSELPRFTL